VLKRQRTGIKGRGRENNSRRRGIGRGKRITDRGRQDKDREEKQAEVEKTGRIRK
jgi:hypothetical protein